MRLAHSGYALAHALEWMLHWTGQHKHARNVWCHGRGWNVLVPRRSLHLAVPPYLLLTK